MDYNTFKNTFTEDVKRTFTEKGKNMEFSTESITKLNERYDALTVKPADSNVGVNINLNSCYKAIESGHVYGDVLEDAIDMVLNALNTKPQLDISSLTDYNAMKSKLTVEVVSAERNRELLEKIPHQVMEDLAIVYRFVLNSDKTGRSSILITNKMIETMDISPEQLHADAVSNSAQYKPLVIKGMNEVIAELMGMSLEDMGLPQNPEEEQIFVASVPDKVHGAGVLAYQGFMDQAAERVGGDFFILPSSVHEILIVPDNGKMGLAELEKMVREVNATEVDPVDKLTDNVYHYDSQAKIFELGEKFMKRQNERDEPEMDKDEKGSLLDDLKAKKN